MTDSNAITWKQTEIVIQAIRKKTLECNVECQVEYNLKDDAVESAVEKYNYMSICIYCRKANRMLYSRHINNICNVSIMWKS